MNPTSDVNEAVDESNVPTITDDSDVELSQSPQPIRGIFMEIASDCDSDKSWCSDVSAYSGRTSIKSNETIGKESRLKKRGQKAKQMLEQQSAEAANGEKLADQKPNGN